MAPISNILWLLLLFTTQATSATIPATGSFSFTGSGCPVVGASGFSTFTAAANAAIAAFNAPAPAPQCGTYTSDYSVTSSSVDPVGSTVTVQLSVYTHSPTPATSTTSATKAIIGTYTCPSGYTGPDAAHNCTPVTSCTVGTVLYSGYFDVGTSPSGTPPSTVCKGGCNGSAGPEGITGPAATSLVGGVTHYYYKGSYVVDSTSSCSPDTATSAVSNSGSTIPSPTCGTGKSVGYINGVSTCYTPSTTPSTTTPPPVTTTQQPAVTSTNPDGSTTTSQTTNNPDGSSTTTSTTCTTTNNCSTTITKTPPTDPAAQKTFCQQNPDVQQCQTQHFDPGTGTGKFDSKTDAINSAKDAIATKISQIRSQAATIITFSGGGTPTLGCSDSYVVLGRAIQICPDKYQNQLTPIGDTLVFGSMAAALMIILR